MLPPFASFSSLSHRPLPSQIYYYHHESQQFYYYHHDRSKPIITTIAWLELMKRPRSESPALAASPIASDADAAADSEIECAFAASDDSA
eukprot:7469754-Lingulodinium_polyedra.AAC.1